MAANAQPIGVIARLPRKEADRHLLEPQDRAGLDPDDPRPQPDRDRLRRKRPAAVLGALPELRHAAGAGLGPGALGERRRRAPGGDRTLPLRRLRRRLVGRAALGIDDGVVQARPRCPRRAVRHHHHLPSATGSKCHRDVNGQDIIIADRDLLPGDTDVPPGNGNVARIPRHPGRP